MSLPVWQATIVNEFGEIIPSPTITVINESTGLGASLFSDRAGSIPLGNNGVFTGGTDGFCQFFTDSGEYRIKAEQAASGFERTYDFVVLVAETAITPTGKGQSQIPKNSDLGGAAQLEASQVINAKNYIVNSDMAVSQENEDASTDVTSNSYFISDQWRTFVNASSGAVINCFRGSINNRKTSGIKTKTAASNLSGAVINLGIQQEIEAESVYSLNGKTVTVAALVRSSISGLLPISIRNSGDDRSFVTDIPVIAGIQDVSFTLPLEANTILNNDNNTGLRVCVAGSSEGDFVTTTPNQWVAGAKLCTNQSTLYGKVLNAEVEITEVRLVEGDTAPEYQPYTDATYNSLRYFEKITATANIDIAVGQATSTSQALDVIGFTVKKRSAPAVSFSNPTSGWNQRAQNGANIPITSMVNISATLSSLKVQPTVASGLIVGSATALRAGGVNEFIYVNARL